jgi:hypothetical protein
MEEEDVEPLFGDETTDPKLWLMTLSNTLPQRNFVRMLVTLWAIWWARRKVIHEDEFQSPLSTHAFINRYIAELDWDRGCDRRGGACKPISAKWIPPSTGRVKINVDGAVAKTANKGAVGAICRDEHGRYLGASTVVYDGIIEPTTLEAYACREALELAEDMNAQKLMIA